MNPLLERIAIDPAVCGGRPCIKGTRIWVSLILDLLAEGMSEPELRASTRNSFRGRAGGDRLRGGSVTRAHRSHRNRSRGVRLKLDENIGRRGLELLRTRGHDVMTVWDQNLRGVTDEALFDICVAEGRALITLDRDFGQILRFPPETSAGIIVRGARQSSYRSSHIGASHRLPRSNGDNFGSAISRSLNHVVSACVRCRSRHPSEAANSHLP